MYNIQKQAASMTIGRKFDAVTGVVLHAGLNDAGNEITYSAGDSTGYVVDIECPIGTQEMAYSVLASLKLRGFRYQPFTADGAIIDPACELGDNIQANGVQSIIFSRSTKYGRLMRSDVAAPHDEEVDHEFAYEPKTQREFKRESAYARSRITQNENEISLEVVRATSAENTLSSRITLTADAITSEVVRATSAESNLGSRIDQRLDSITLSVTSSNGSSTFAIKDGSVTLDTKTADLTVSALNIIGKVQIGQIQDASVVTSSVTETEYYLSTSSSSATGGSWSTTVPTWASGKYIWTRQKTTDTKNGGTSSTTYKPSQNGAYDKNLTEALSTATSASSAAATAQSTADGAASAASTANNNALSATKRTSIIYHSMSGGSAPTAPSAWVTDVTGGQNKWTLIRPEYSSSYPACYIAQQSETVGGTYSCTTPKVDATTTIIDGAHIITGTIDATKISVDNLQAISASLAGWTLSATQIKKTVENQYEVYLQAPASPTSSNAAINVRAYENSAWDNKFTVYYDGRFVAKDATITGSITATSLTLGTGVTIPYASVSGTPDLTVYVAKDGTIGSTPSASTTGFKVSSAGLLTASNAIIYGTLYSSSGTIGGWTLSDNRIGKSVSNTYSIQLNAPASPTDSDNAFAVVKYVDSAWQTQIALKYGGQLYARNAQITGEITATSGTIGGVTISNGVLSGISSTNIASGGVLNGNIGIGAVTGGYGGSIAGETITSGNTVLGVQTNLGWGAAFGDASNASSGNYQAYFRAATIYSSSDLYANSQLHFGGYYVNRSTISIKDGDGITRSFNVLTYSYSPQ